MPHAKSAKKRARQNECRRGRNRAARSKLRTSAKKARAAAEGDPQSPATEEILRRAAGDLDRAARKGLIKKNQASRRKRRLELTRNRAASAPRPR